jgi:mono/diheme cytochrome c family protein
MLILIGTGLLACDMKSGKVERWYSQEQVARGAAVFAAFCAACHGDRAQGLVTGWQRRQPDGSLPPPPLNGSAHAWHHALPLLIEIVQKGGVLYNGKMPGFKDRLSEEQQLASIAWFQSLWSDEIYRLWEQGNQAPQLSGKPVSARILPFGQKRLY